MFGIGYSELLVIAIVGLVVIGPKDLPRVMRQVGRWVGKAQGMARHFRSGIDTMIREAELEEMEKKWREENERIMREHPLFNAGAEMTPLPAPAPGAEAAAETLSETALPTEAAAWEPQAAEAAGAAEPSAPDPAPESDAPELPLGPPAAPTRELP